MDMARAKMLVTIVDRNKEEFVTEICELHDAHFHIAFLGKGTASNEILDYLGLGETDKAITMSLVSEHRVNRIRKDLVKRLQMRIPGKGILFTVPIKALTGRIARHLSEQEAEGDEKMIDLNPEQFGLIVTMINQGHSEEVMDAAHSAGATGGTLVHARRVGGEEIAKFFGITLQQEREIVIILAKNDVRSNIMKSIGSVAGLTSPAQGVVLSLPVDAIDGLS